MHLLVFFLGLVLGANLLTIVIANHDQITNDDTISEIIKNTSIITVTSIENVRRQIESEEVPDGILNGVGSISNDIVDKPMEMDQLHQQDNTGNDGMIFHDNEDDVNINATNTHIFDSDPVIGIHAIVDVVAADATVDAVDVAVVAVVDDVVDDAVDLLDTSLDDVVPLVEATPVDNSVPIDDALVNDEDTAMVSMMSHVSASKMEVIDDWTANTSTHAGSVLDVDNNTYNFDVENDTETVVHEDTPIANNDDDAILSSSQSSQPSPPPSLPSFVYKWPLFSRQCEQYTKLANAFLVRHDSKSAMKQIEVAIKRDDERKCIPGYKLRAEILGRKQMQQYEDAAMDWAKVIELIATAVTKVPIGSDIYSDSSSSNSSDSSNSNSSSSSSSSSDGNNNHHHLDSNSLVVNEQVINIDNEGNDDNDGGSTTGLKKNKSTNIRSRTNSQRVGRNSERKTQTNPVSIFNNMSISELLIVSWHEFTSEVTAVAMKFHVEFAMKNMKQFLRQQLLLFINSKDKKQSQNHEIIILNRLIAKCALLSRLQDQIIDIILTSDGTVTSATTIGAADVTEIVPKVSAEEVSLWWSWLRYTWFGLSVHVGDIQSASEALTFQSIDDSEERR